MVISKPAKRNNCLTFKAINFDFLKAVYYIL